MAILVTTRRALSRKLTLKCAVWVIYYVFPGYTYSLFAPLRYTPSYPYPLIVWLHGYGSDERQLVRVMPLVSMQNYVAVAPAAR